MKDLNFRLQRVLNAFIVLIMLTGCVQATPTAEKPPPPEPMTLTVAPSATITTEPATATERIGGTMVELTEEDNGSIVTVIVGDIIQIQLEGNPTTGYSWGTENLDTNLLEMIGEPAFEANSKLKGSGGIYTFTFNALAPGVIQLRLKYFRSFEENVPPVQTFEVSLDIQE